MSERISKAEVARLRELERQIAAAPWDEECCSGAIRHVIRNCDHDFYCVKEEEHDIFGKCDGRFIAKSRNLLPALLDTLDEAMEALTGIIERCWCNDAPYPGYAVRNGKKTPCENCTPARRLLGSWDGEVKP